MDVTVADKQSLWLYCDHIISHASDHRILFVHYMSTLTYVVCV